MKKNKEKQGNKTNKQNKKNMYFREIYLFIIAFVISVKE